MCNPFCLFWFRSVDGYTRLYDIRFGQLKEDCMGEPVTSVCFTNDGQCILASSLDSSIRLIDKDTGGVLNTYKGHINKEYKIDSTLMSRDSHVISGSEDGCLYFWDLIKAEITTKVTSAHGGVIYTLSRHPTKNYLLTAAMDSVKLWSGEEEVMS